MERGSEKRSGKEGEREEQRDYRPVPNKALKRCMKDVFGGK